MPSTAISTTALSVCAFDIFRRLFIEILAENGQLGLLASWSHGRLALPVV
jgi:hypothetical protein